MDITSEDIDAIILRKAEDDLRLLALEANVEFPELLWPSLIKAAVRSAIHTTRRHLVQHPEHLGYIGTPHCEVCNAAVDTWRLFSPEETMEGAGTLPWKVAQPCGHEQP